MRLFVSIMAFSLLLAACQKDNDKDATQLGGLYSGTFNRTGMDTSTVSLDFSGDRFDGTSDQEKYPAICHGSFDADENMIVFTDSCAWTADFDWSLILNGTYNLSFQNDNTIRIWRTNGIVTDEYLLRKVVR